MDLKQLAEHAAKGGMKRREFIQFGLALGLTTAAAATTLFSKAVRAEPKKDGTFRIALGSGVTTDTLDPATYPDTFNGVFGSGTVRSSLTEVAADAKIVPDAAESFEAADDAKTWVFKIRKGVEFHNGKSLDADDVVASINHHQSDESKSTAKSLLKAVTDVKADGKETVIVTLSDGNADFPYIVSDYHIPMMPAKDGKADWQSGVGTGPYAMTSFQPGVDAKAKRFENYYGQTWFDEIEILSVIDVAARTNALTSGEVHFIDRVDLKTADFLTQNPDLSLAEVQGFAHYVAPMNVTVAPFDNKDVRLALKYAINREEIVKKVLYGHGSPAMTIRSRRVCLTPRTRPPSTPTIRRRRSSISRRRD